MCEAWDNTGVKRNTVGRRDSDRNVSVKKRGHNKMGRHTSNKQCRGSKLEKVKQNTFLCTVMKRKGSWRVDNRVLEHIHQL